MIELITVVAILAVITAVAIPNYIGWLPGHRLRSARPSSALGYGLLEHLGDAEVQELHRAVGAHEHIRRLQVAVHHQIAVREVHGARHGDHQQEPFAEP
jgi:hypothetical protein